MATVPVTVVARFFQANLKKATLYTVAYPSPSFVRILILKNYSTIHVQDPVHKQKHLQSFPHEVLRSFIPTW